jgi:uncharacterized delta-60 repeat protein
MKTGYKKSHLLAACFIALFSANALAIDTDGDGIDDVGGATFYSTSFDTASPEWIFDGWNRLNDASKAHSSAYSMYLNCFRCFSSTMSLTLTIPVPAKINFWVKGSGNANFQIDNGGYYTLGLASTWQNAANPGWKVFSGSHTFKWYPQSGGTASVYVDDVSVTTLPDNCPLVSNSTQLDKDNDGLGDACDDDDDGDGVLDTSDNCPLNSNSNQLDTDGDAQGNVCDADDDNDGVSDVTDKFPLNAAASSDTDVDTFPDAWNAACDLACQTSSGLTLDNCPTTSNANQLNTDGDAQGDACDSLPLNVAASIDTDLDGAPDAWNAACDLACQASSGLTLDNCPTILNADQLNTDGDAQGDACDTDDDNDGVLDASDNCPLISNANQLDSDSDTQGDVCDAEPFIPGAGALDTSFNPGTGVNNGVLTVAVQTDDKIIIGGNFITVNGVARRSIARLNADGSVDDSFNPGTGASSGVYTSAVQADGKIIMGGNFTSVNGVARNYIARLNADGSVDDSFNPGANSYVETSAVQADGKILIGGGFTSVNGVAINRIARLNTDGSVDLSFNSGTGGGTTNAVWTIAVQADGKIIIGGGFTSVNGVARSRIARLNADGSVDSSFNPGTGVNNIVEASAVQADGKIMMGGWFTTVNGVTRNYIARLNADGSVDPSFNPGAGANNYVYTIAVQADGKMIIGGEFTTVNGIARNYIARLNADASVDPSFNPGLGESGAVTIIAAQADGKIIVGGGFTTVNGVAINRIARIHTGDSDGDGIQDAADYGDVKNDYNNDGIAGWIWKGISNGNETASQNWQLTFPLYSPNWAAPNRFYHPVFPDQLNWEIATSGDFNKDGDADILWRNLATAEWKVWQMQNGLRVAQNAPADFDLTHEWTVIGAGDTDKDGDDDVILNNIATGEVLIWQMQNHAVAATHVVGTKAGYTLNRIGDFNKDGDVDLLFRQNSADVLITWEIQTNAFVTERALANTGTGYNPVCSGDFDKDGDDDIMFINNSTMQEKWFVMENFARSQVVGSTNTGFVFKGCGDYDGDGDADILWQRLSDDANRVILQQNYGASKQTVYTNVFGAVNGFVYRGNSN